MSTIWAELASATAADGVLHGLPPGRLLSMFQLLADNETMRRTTDGVSVSARQRGIFERSFMARFAVSPLQFGCVAALFDQYEGSGIIDALRNGPPPTLPGQRPAFVRRCFGPDVTYCCGSTLRVRLVMATLYCREGCFPAWHVVKECNRGCGTTYYADKKCLPGVVGGSSVRIHLSPPWTTGVPTHVFSKSGKAICCTKFLTDVAIAQCKQRSGFETLALQHSRTVGFRGGGGTLALTGPVLLELWALFAILKLRQGVGVCLWRNVDGSLPDLSHPCETAIVDRRGDQSGQNFWPGLRIVIDRYLPRMRTDSPWPSHKCNLCTKFIDVRGGIMRVQAASYDGVNSVSVRKCKTLGCVEDLPSHGDTRFCNTCEPEFGWRCAVTSPPTPPDAAEPLPPCPNARREGHFSCPEHANLEEDWRRYNRMGGWFAQARARKAGEAVESGRARYLRSMFSPQTTKGQFVASYSCGIIVNMSPLYEGESQDEVARALNQIWPVPATRPLVTFYDLGCRRRHHLEANPDPAWAGTMNYVDRFHHQTHVNARCIEFCSPERRDNPLLWHRDVEGNLHFNWNSSVQESNNNFMSGLAHIVSNMPRVMAEFVLANNARVHNELLLAEKLQGQSPTTGP